MVMKNTKPVSNAFIYAFITKNQGHLVLKKKNAKGLNSVCLPGCSYTIDQSREINHQMGAISEALKEHLIINLGAYPKTIQYIGIDTYTLPKSEKLIEVISVDVELNSGITVDTSNLYESYRYVKAEEEPWLPYNEDSVIKFIENSL